MRATKKYWIAALCLLSCLAFYFVVGAILAPHMSIERQGTDVIVHVETLGEYPTTIKSVQIRDSKDKILFSLRANPEGMQMRKFRLHAGRNLNTLVIPDHGSYEVLAPGPGSGFVLQAGDNYTISLRGDGWMSVQKTVVL